MYCHQCNKTFAADAIYCSQCGNKLLQHNITILHTVGIWPDENQSDGEILDVEQAKQSKQKRQKKKFINKKRVTISGNKSSTNDNFSIKVIIGFLVLWALIIGILFYSYKKQANVNEVVLNYQSMAKVEALSGNYEQALEYLQEAIRLRPNYNSLIADEEIVYHAIRIERMSEEIRQLIEQGKELEAEEKLERLRQELKGYKEPLFENHRAYLEELNVKYSVLSLTNELTRIGTIEELGNLLNVVNGLIGEEATSLKEQIIERIRTTAAAEINTLLDRKRYTAALSTVDDALAWVRGDEVLLELKQHIKQEQAAYTRAEEERIQRAMEQAAAEDYINQTAAIELTDFEKGMNELGDMVIVAYLKNVATRPIYDVTVQYEVRNEAGAVIVEGSSGVTPNYIGAGEGMSFSVTLPDGELSQAFMNEQELTLKIVNGSWNLE